MKELFENIKTGELYILEQANVVNATNANDGQMMVLYANLNGKTYVREAGEFYAKFKRYEM